MIRDTVHRIETIDETAYVHFSPAVQGTKIVLPARRLVQIRRGGRAEGPDRIDASWAGGGELELKLMSAEARIAKWRRAIDGLRLTADTDVTAMRADTALLQQMIDHEAAQASGPLQAALNELSFELAFRRLQWGLVEPDPLDRYFVDGDDDYDDNAAEDEW